MIELVSLWQDLQRRLFPVLEEEIGPLSELDQQFCQVISLTDLGGFTRSDDWCGNGCPPHSRTWLAHALIAKHPFAPVQ